MEIKKQEFWKMLLVVWIFSATAYVALDIWNDYKIDTVERVRQETVNQTIGQFFQYAKQNPCKPIPVQLGEEKMSLIDTGCIGEPKKDSEESE